jgi:hypothetical protein
MTSVNESYVNGYFVIDNSHYINSPYHIPAYNHNHTLPADYISPNSAAAQLGLTSAEMAPILQEQRELMRDEFTQPPTEPTTYYKHTTRAESPHPPLIHPNSAAAQLGLTPTEAAEVDQECIRAQQEIQKEIEESRIVRERKTEQNARAPPSPLGHTHDTTQRTANLTTRTYARHDTAHSELHRHPCRRI